MVVIITLICLGYAGLLVACYIQWRGMGITEDQKEDSNPAGVTVVVAVRNEEDNVQQFISSLADQNYPRDKWEVVVVDDDSQDETLRLLESLSLSYQNLSYHRLDSPANFIGSFKKRALAYGIAQAKFSRVITTDADCSFPREWLATTIGFMRRNDLQFVSGPVRVLSGDITGSSLWELETGALMIVGASFLAWGKPNMCNGANIAFDKQAYERVDGYGGFETVVSGDDEFLLYKIWRRYPKRIGYLKHQDAMVDTAPPKSWKEMLDQRKRWSGKWKHHRSWTTRGLATFIFIFHSSWLMIHVGALLAWFPWQWLPALWGLKIGAELSVMRAAFGFQEKRFPWGWFLIGQLLYSPYAVVMGLAANFGSYKWKDRSYS